MFRTMTPDGPDEALGCIVLLALAAVVVLGISGTVGMCEEPEPIPGGLLAEDPLVCYQFNDPGQYHEIETPMVEGGWKTVLLTPDDTGTFTVCYRRNHLE